MSGSRMTVPLREIAHGRSGDKGSGSNIGVIAHTAEGYEFLRSELTAERVEHYFNTLKPSSVKRFEWPAIRALNFVLSGILAGGGSRSLRIDAQGKALAVALLEMPMEIPEEIYERSLRKGDL
jgi:hypothetical protein